MQPSAGQSGVAESLSHMSLAVTIAQNNNNSIIQDWGGGWCSRTEQAIDQHASVQAACVLLCAYLLWLIEEKHRIFEINFKETFSVFNAKVTFSAAVSLLYSLIYTAP